MRNRGRSRSRRDLAPTVAPLEGRALAAPVAVAAGIVVGGIGGSLTSDLVGPYNAPDPLVPTPSRSVGGN